jgi:transglutaminase-like putative cysteine protease
VKRIVGALPLLVASALFTYVTGTPVLLLMTVLGAPVALWLSPHVELGTFLQCTAMATVIVLGGLIGGGLLADVPGVGPTGLPAVWATVAMVCILLALVRRFFRDPLGAERLDFAILALAVVACGERRYGTVYLVAAVAFVAAAVATLRSREGAVSWRVVEGHGGPALAAMLGIAVGFVVASGVGLPWLQELLQHRLERAIMEATTSRTGFTDRLRLSSFPDAILESNEMVMRVYGPPVDYLRGQVYDRYNQGAWSWSKDLAPVEIRTAVGRPAGATGNEIRTVGDARSRDSRPHYFLPLGARRLGTPHGAALADATGTLRPLAEELPTPVYFDARRDGGAAEPPVRDPTPEDLVVPIELGSTLAPIASDWAFGATTARAKLIAIERHLRTDFRYSLEPVRPERHEPFLVHFLIHDRRGHCEYFATALAMLARQAGVPARVVGGYRVAEHNPVGGYDIVREQNAHAWVEAWVDGEGWRTFDATPATEANESHETSRLFALTDAIASAWDRLADAIARASLWQILGALAAAVGALALARWLRARRARATGMDGASAPLACFTRLEGELARRGVARTASESLESYEKRLRDAALEEAAELVRTYGALRYGGIGDAGEVVARIEAYVSRTLSRSPREGAGAPPS